MIKLLMDSCIKFVVSRGVVGIGLTMKNLVASDKFGLVRKTYRAETSAQANRLVFAVWSVVQSKIISLVTIKI